MASKHICPKCGGRTFSTPAHVMQDWKVNEDGEFIETLDECLQVSFEPSDGNIWSCTDCEEEAVIVPEEFTSHMDDLSLVFAVKTRNALEQALSKLHINENKQFADLTANQKKAFVDWIEKTFKEQ